MTATVNCQDRPGPEVDLAEAGQVGGIDQEGEPGPQRSDEKGEKDPR